MPRVSNNGSSAIKDCRPKYAYWSAGASQKTLFQNWPENQLEPTGNPAYEGYGYPAAGYGERRRKVVGLAQPRVAANPQLSHNGWEEQKQPQMSVVDVFTLNKKSDNYSRAEVATLAGLGCNCTKTDRIFRAGLQGLGQVNSGVQELARGIVNGTVPDYILNKLTDKIISDEKSNAEAFNAVRKLKLLTPNDPSIAPIQREQETAWGQTNTAKFYALLLPQMQDRLGFTSGNPKVTPPDYAYIISGKDPGVFTKVADVLREQLVGDAAKRLISAGYMKNSALNGLGFAPVVFGIGAALIIAAGITAYLMSEASKLAAERSRSALIGLCSTGKVSKSVCEAALREGAPTSTIETVFKYGAIGLGALVALQVIGSIRSAFPGK